MYRHPLICYSNFRLTLKLKITFKLKWGLFLQLALKISFSINYHFQHFLMYADLIILNYLSK